MTRIAVEALGKLLVFAVVRAELVLRYVGEVNAGRGLKRYLTAHGVWSNPTIAVVCIAIITPIVIAFVVLEAWREIRDRRTQTGETRP